MKKITNTIVLLLILVSTLMVSYDIKAMDVEVVSVEKEQVTLGMLDTLVTPEDSLSTVADLTTYEELEEAYLREIQEEFQLREVRIQPLTISDKLFYRQEEVCEEYNMFDKNPLTGFIDDLGYCNPGLVTTEVWFTKSPRYVYGTAVPYSPGMMKATAVWRQMGQEAYGNDTEYLGGVATPSPADIGETVWLRREGHEWEGPYLVVDCSRRADMGTHIAINQQVVEIDFDTAVRWNMAYYTNDWWAIDIAIEYPVEVYYGMEKPVENIREFKEPIFFPEYWVKNVADYQREKIELAPWIVEFGINPTWDMRDGSDPICFTTACSHE